MATDKTPALVVFTHVFPNSVHPTYGVFVQERMFRVAETLPVTVVAPVPWFPGQGILRRFRPGYRPPVPYHEVQQGIDVYHPRFLSIPRYFKFLDGLFEAVFCFPLLQRLKRQGRLDILDAHFVYPDGVAAWLLGKWLGVPHTITLRGTILRIARTRSRRWQALRAMNQAAKVFSVADALRQTAIGMGVGPGHVQVVPNGVNLELFSREDQAACRAALKLPPDAKVIITVGTLNERKGFHRVIEQMPELLKRYPDLIYLAVGGENPDGDRGRLERLAQHLGVADHVVFLGHQSPDRLKYIYSAADLFVLATQGEGWANVFLEAAACGLPIVTTRVGGNAEVVSSDAVGELVPFGDGDALRCAVLSALDRNWNIDGLSQYVAHCAWENRIPALVAAFKSIGEERSCQ
ncbi:glycosyltransferase [Ectothiorhodospira haloalkaliphila]|uniref:glycosyltransferase n=1 Tax=Ectothiorhodospira haloalkaliphila TaxID=421628 RepID=UPI001EE93B5E|nr:glycosyltransferase [Ectothiorhodospira haloalkaliphila]MCG5524351.1 glycosyltransferase [Ectothiorhodospira haloalkaliphila]